MRLIILKGAVSIEELLVSSFAQADALAKLSSRRASSRSRNFREDFRGTSDISGDAKADITLTQIVCCLGNNPLGGQGGFQPDSLQIGMTTNPQIRMKATENKMSTSAKSTLNRGIPRFSGSRS